MVAGRPPNQDTDETRNAIIDAAGPLFASRGYHATSMRELARAAGVTPAALQHHFGPKRDLYVAVSTETQWRVYRDLEEIIATPGTLMDRLEAVLGLEERLASTGQASLQFLSSVGIDVVRHPELAAAVGSVPFTDLYERLTQAGVERGELEPEDAPRLVRVLRVLLTGIGIQSFVGPADALHATVQDCVDLVRGELLGVSGR